MTIDSQKMNDWTSSTSPVTADTLASGAFDLGRIATEFAVRISDTTFRAVSNAIPHMMWSASPDGRHDYFNSQWYDFTGVPEGSTDGDHWCSVFHPDDQSEARQVWHRSLTTGDTFEIQYRLRHHSGSYRWMLGKALPVHNKSGKITRWMGTYTDIQEQKAIEERLRKMAQRKDEFLMTLAHEMRNPLAPISAAAVLLQRARHDETRVRDAAEIIQRQADHLTCLVNDLLDVSRIVRNSVELNNLPLDLNLVVLSAIEQVTPLIQCRGQLLTFHRSPGPAMVIGDYRRLVQVAANLLNNAAKYTHEGGEIIVSVELRAAHISMTVVDNGIGMAPALVSHVFDIFEQAEHTSDRASGGLGLGLPLVKSLVELHGGTVSCVSEGTSKGSRFSVCLPKLQAFNNNQKNM